MWNIYVKIFYFVIGAFLCVYSDDVKPATKRKNSFRINQIANKILQELGMKSIPHIMPEDVKMASELYESSRILEMYNDDGDQTDVRVDEIPEAKMFATKFKVYVAQCRTDALKDKTPPCGEMMHYPIKFDVQAKPGFVSHVNSAWLKLYAHGNSGHGCNESSPTIYTIRVYQNNHESTNCRTELATVELRAEFRGWLSVNVSAAAHSWLNSKRPELGTELSLTVENQLGELENPYPLMGRYVCQNGRLESDQLTIGELEQNFTDSNNYSRSHSFTVPSIEVTVVESPKLSSREKRAARNGRQRCKRVPIYLSFSDIGWNEWVLQPQGFETGFCSGSCGKIGWRIDLSRNSSEGFTQRFECCAPSKMKPMKIVHFDETRKLSLSVLENFLVTDCECATGSG